MNISQIQMESTSELTSHDCVFLPVVYNDVPFQIIPQTINGRKFGFLCGKQKSSMLETDNISFLKRLALDKFRCSRRSYKCYTIWPTIGKLDCGSTCIKCLTVHIPIAAFPLLLSRVPRHLEISEVQKDHSFEGISSPTLCFRYPGALPG